MKIKHIILTSIISLPVCHIMAQENAVMLHHQGIVTQFLDKNKSLVNAYNSAADGDTIYLPGGVFDQPEYAKQLHIYGAGIHPDSSVVTGRTILNGTTLLRKGADNFYMEGVETNNIYYIYSDTVENVTFKNMKINGNITYNSSTALAKRLNISKCIVMGSINLKNAQGAVIENCIVQSKITDSNYNLIRNNMLIYGSTNPLSGTGNHIVNNCFRTSGNIVDGVSNFCYNNILRSNSTNAFGTNAVYKDNYQNLSTDTLLVNANSGTFDFTQDYHFKESINYVGNDGTPVGIYGGKHPYTDGLIPSNPHIRRNESAEETDNEGKLQLNINVISQ